MKHHTVLILALLCSVRLLLPETALGESGSRLTAEDWRQDYREACTWIARQDIYLEEKTGLSPDAFLQKALEGTRSIGDRHPREDFLQALRTLRGQIADGHFDWMLRGPGLGAEGDRWLGIILTMDGERLVVASADLAAQRQGFAPGAEILTWDGQSPKDALAAATHWAPQSTLPATLEVAARNLTFQHRGIPLRSRLNPVRVAFRLPDGTPRSDTLAWKLGLPRLNRNGYPSLEEIPPGALSPHPSLSWYPLAWKRRHIVVLHLRDFAQWNVLDLSQTFGTMLQTSPDLIVIDLKDSAGGAFEQVVWLSAALRVTNRFPVEARTRDERTGKIIRRSYDFSDHVAPAYQGPFWTGPVALRTNAICGSAGDYFVRWFRLHHRGFLFGEATAGRGGGSDNLDLSHSGTTVTIPLRDRRIIGDPYPIEGMGTSPDFVCEGSLVEGLHILDRHGTLFP